MGAGASPTSGGVRHSPGKRSTDTNGHTDRSVRVGLGAKPTGGERRTRSRRGSYPSLPVRWSPWLTLVVPDSGRSMVIGTWSDRLAATQAA